MTPLGKLRRAIGLLALLGLCSLSVPGAASSPIASTPPLKIYFIDVEGGQATLFVTPAGQSLLIDAGWPGFGGRDADRIVAAAKDAGIGKIDFVLLTHYHADHAGGVPGLAAKIPIGAFIDHGENREPNGDTEQAWQAYRTLVSEQHLPRTLAKAGDALALTGIESTVISADGAILDHALPGAGATNTACNTAPQPPVDVTENARSLGVLFTFGKLRILDLGDLTADKERLLMCPINKIGTIDIFVVSHHGTASSNSPLFLNAIAPRVAIMDNGATKGGAPSSWDSVKQSGRLEDLWQLHFSERGAAHNVAEPFIANSSGPDAGNYLKLTAWPDGRFEVFNSRTQASKRYARADRRLVNSK
jgi:beta-lactamase superfamily II metal-dependent hydrolase